MHAYIEVDGTELPCQIFSPHNQPEVKFSLPGGAEGFQPAYPQYNAKLVFPVRGPVIRTGMFKIRKTDGKVVQFSAEKHDSDTVWGNLSLT
jgi:hypothetical protein